MKAYAVRTVTSPTHVNTAQRNDPAAMPWASAIPCHLPTPIDVPTTDRTFGPGLKMPGGMEKGSLPHSLRSATLLVSDARIGSIATGQHASLPAPDPPSWAGTRHAFCNSHRTTSTRRVLFDRRSTAEGHRVRQSWLDRRNGVGTVTSPLIRYAASTSRTLKTHITARHKYSRAI
jgi:hypothetical protein